MYAEVEYQIEGKTFRAVAIRKDLFFGNGVSISIYTQDGSLWAKTSCHCHIDFEGFDDCQSLNTEQLLAIAVGKLKEGGHASIEQALPHGISVMFRLNGHET